ncbi:MAG: cation transporter [Actinobacteria bacterium]|nr:cation transporter [Actinomycetota bacterium]
MSRHDHWDRHGTVPAGNSRPLSAALLLVAAFVGVEVAAGLVSGSLALLADAGHMLSDALALALALGAAWLARRPATPDRSFGLRRAEILAALANALVLVVIALGIFVEAGRRLSDPPDVLGGWMLVVGFAGLLVNLAAARLLWSAGSASLNVRAALRHVIADGLGSIGVIAAALLVVTTGWVYADPAVSVLIGLLVLASAWSPLKESLEILLEVTPAGLDAGEVGHAMAASSGVVEVHDLHIWTITSGFPALSAHVLVRPADDCHGVRRALERMLQERFGLDHTTLQVEHAAPLSTPVELGRTVGRRTPLRRR